MSKHKMQSQYCPWTDEIKAFVKENYVGVGPTEMTSLVNKTFNAWFVPGQMKAFYSRNNLKSYVTGYFEKGHATFNKGKKQSEYMTAEAIERTKATQFHKGHLPHNTKPIGYERITKEGYIEVKVRMRPSRPACKDNWKGKHILVWEEHNGPVPKGYVIRFLDGNKQNCNIDNLVLLSRAEHCELTRRHLYFDEPEITKVGVSVAKLNCAVSERKNK